MQVYNYNFPGQERLPIHLDLDYTPERTGQKAFFDYDGENLSDDDRAASEGLRTKCTNSILLKSSDRRISSVVKNPFKKHFTGTNTPVYTNLDLASDSEKAGAQSTGVLLHRRANTISNFIEYKPKPGKPTNSAFF